jgi:hypothetical protein
MPSGLHVKLCAYLLLRPRSYCPVDLIMLVCQEKAGWMVWSGLIWLGTESSDRPFERCNELSYEDLPKLVNISLL